MDWVWGGSGGEGPQLWDTVDLESGLVCGDAWLVCLSETFGRKQV